MDLDDPNLLKSPKRVGIVYGTIVFLICAVIVIVIFPPSQQRAAGYSDFEFGFQLGIRLLPVAVLAYAVGHWRQQRRG